MVMVREITETIDVGFDLVDDTCMHMRNDPDFYRREYFPTMAKVADMQREGNKDNPQKTIMLIGYMLKIVQNNLLEWP